MVRAWCGTGAARMRGAGEQSAVCTPQTVTRALGLCSQTALRHGCRESGAGRRDWRGGLDPRLQTWFARLAASTRLGLTNRERMRSRTTFEYVIVGNKKGPALPLSLFI